MWSGRCSARFSDVLPRFSVPTCPNCPMGRPEAPVVPTKFSKVAALVPAASSKPLLKSKLPKWLYLSVIRLLYSYRRPSVPSAPGLSSDTPAWFWGFGLKVAGPAIERRALGHVSVFWVLGRGKNGTFCGPSKLLTLETRLVICVQWPSGVRYW